jgi:hypothetical protein
MSPVEKIGSVTTPGSIGTRYGRFAVFTPAGWPAVAIGPAETAKAHIASKAESRNVVLINASSLPLIDIRV